MDSSLLPARSVDDQFVWEPFFRRVEEDSVLWRRVNEKLDDSRTKKKGSSSTIPAATKKKRELFVCMIPHQISPAPELSNRNGSAFRSHNTMEDRVTVGTGNLKRHIESYHLDCTNEVAALVHNGMRESVAVAKVADAALIKEKEFTKEVPRVARQATIGVSLVDRSEVCS